MSFLPELVYQITSSTAHNFAAGGSSSTGIPVFMANLPDGAPDTAVVVLESGGTGALYTHSGIRIERPTAQVITRSASYANARSAAKDIYDILSSITNAPLQVSSSSTDVTQYLTVTPLQSPADMGQDAEARQLVTCNYMAEKELS